jgi:hypothetical protein
MNFRASADPTRLHAWLTETNASAPHHTRSFARWLMRDLQAVRNAITEPWSNAQAEGQINKLKTLKRSMYGRASVEQLRARPHSDRRLVGALRLRKSQLMAASQIDASARYLKELESTWRS